jgi:hypothetical protein
MAAIGGNAHREVAIEETVCVLRAVFCTRREGWRQAEGLSIRGMQEAPEASSPASLVGGESRILSRSLRLCEGMASKTQGKQWISRQSDTRRETPFKINAALCFVDTGEQDGGDTRRDRSAKA